MTQHVIVEDGPIRWVVAICTVLAVFIAVGAFLLSIYQAKAASSELRKERRRVFELGALVTLAEMVGNGLHRYQDSNNPCGLILATLRPDDLPSLRKTLGVPGSAPYQPETEHAAMQAIRQELREAINRRMDA